MAAGVPPPPLNSPTGSYYWLEWYTNLTNFLNGTNIPWANINFTNANIADIPNRAHNSLVNIQGGNASGTAEPTGNAWHMTGRGYVDATGVATGFPTGWTCVHSGTGVYSINHTLGLMEPQISAVAVSNTVGVVVQYVDISATNLIVVHLTDPTGTTSANAAFSLIVNS